VAAAATDIRNSIGDRERKRGAKADTQVPTAELLSTNTCSTAELCRPGFHARRKRSPAPPADGAQRLSKRQSEGAAEGYFPPCCRRMYSRMD
jgi:hypothetical protein